MYDHSDCIIKNKINQRCRSVLESIAINLIWGSCGFGLPNQYMCPFLSRFSLMMGFRKIILRLTDHVWFMDYNLLYWFNPNQFCVISILSHHKIEMKNCQKCVFFVFYLPKYDLSMISPCILHDFSTISPFCFHFRYFTSASPRFCQDLALYFGLKSPLSSFIDLCLLHVWFFFLLLCFCVWVWILGVVDGNSFCCWCRFRLLRYCGNGGYEGWVSISLT